MKVIVIPKGSIVYHYKPIVLNSYVYIYIYIYIYIHIYTYIYIDIYTHTDMYMYSPMISSSFMGITIPLSPD